MKRMVDYTKMQNSALTIALVFLLAGCAFALLQAFGGASSSISLIAPLFVMI